MRSLSLGTKAVVAAFLTSGTIHLVRPQVFESIVPHVLPRKRELVYSSGVAELACAVGMLTPRTRHVAGIASVGILVAVFPANVQMAVDAQRAITRKGSTRRRQIVRGVAMARLPLQVPLIRWALRA